MLNIIIAPFVLVLWAGSGRSITIPQNSLAICEQNAKVMTEDGKSWAWTYYKCVPTGMSEPEGKK